MFDPAEIQAAYYMVAATGVLVAAIYYVYSMRINHRNSTLALKSGADPRDEASPAIHADLREIL